MVDKRFRRYVQSFMLVLPMTGLVTAVNTIVARGFDAVITLGLLRRWGISLLIAFPAVLLVAPLAAKMTDAIIKQD